MKKRRQVLMSLVLAVSMVLPYSTAFAAEVTVPGGSVDSEVTLTVGNTAPKIFSVTVPSEIPINITKDGTIEVAKNLNIRNDSSDDVRVTAINVEGKNGWSVAEFAADFSAKPENAKVIAMAFRNGGTDAYGDIALAPNNWNIGMSTSLDIEAQVKLAKQTQEASKANIATVHWSFDWKDATDTPDVPDTSAISHNWKNGTPMLIGSAKDVTFDWSSTADTNSIASVESSAPGVATVEPSAVSTYITGQGAYTLTGKSVGTTTITATLTSGESTSFDVTVNEIKPGTGGDGDDIEITIPGDTLQPGDKLDPDMEIEIPVTGPDGDTTITVKPEVPDTELKPGDNEIQIEVDVSGVKITIIIKVTLKGGNDNPSDGLAQSIEEAQAMGFTFSSYEDGLQIDSFENKQFKKEINVPEQIGDFKVLKLANEVFKDQTNLTRITLPSTMKELGRNVFAGCSNADILISGRLSTSKDAFDSAYYTSGSYNGFTDVGLRDAAYSSFSGVKGVYVSDITNLSAAMMFNIIYENTPIFVNNEPYEYAIKNFTPRTDIPDESDEDFIRLTAYPYLRNGTKPYVVVMAESGPINMTDVDITYEHRGPEIKWNSGSKEEDSWLHEINIDLPDLSEYGTILDAYIPMEDGQYHSQSSSCGLNVHIEAGDEHFHQEYGRSEINSKMIYWCSRCEN